MVEKTCCTITCYYDSCVPKDLGKIPNYKINSYKGRRENSQNGARQRAQETTALLGKHFLLSGPHLNRVLVFSYHALTSVSVSHEHTSFATHNLKEQKNTHESLSSEGAGSLWAGEVAETDG